MDGLESLKPGKREGAFFVERQTDTEKIGVQSPYNGMFYAYAWDPDQQKTVATLVGSSDLQFH